MNNGTWLMMDYEAGECELSQVGSPKQQAAEATGDVDLHYSEQLKRGAMLAYRAMGGPEYLRRNPELLDKMLLKMVADPAQKVDSEITLRIIAPWMSPDRLSYSRQDAIDVTPKPLAIESAPPNTPDETAEAYHEHRLAEIKSADKAKAIKAKRIGHAGPQPKLPPTARPVVDPDPPEPGTARAVEASIAAKKARAPGRKPG